MVVRRCCCSHMAIREMKAAFLTSHFCSSPTAAKPVTTPCWQLEEFIVTTSCSQCSAFQAVSAQVWFDIDTFLWLYLQRHNLYVCGLVKWRRCVFVVPEVVVGLWTDGIRGESQLYQIKQRRVQEVRLSHCDWLFWYWKCIDCPALICAHFLPPIAAALQWWRSISSGSSKQPCWQWRLSLPSWWSSVSAGSTASPLRRSADRSSPSRTPETPGMGSVFFFFILQHYFNKWSLNWSRVRVWTKYRLGWLGDQD